MTHPILNILILSAIINAWPVCARAQDTGWDTYKDPQGRFEFSYPRSFGQPTIDSRLDMSGGDSGETLHFPEFSYGMRNNKIYLEGDLVVRTGRVWVGAQALGGTYDPLTLGSMIDIFPPALQARLREQATNLTLSDFCDELEKEKHISEDDPSLSGLTPERQKAIMDMDHVRNEAPRIVRCEVLGGDTVVFDKEVTARFGVEVGRQHIYGAIRFLDGTFSSVQFIRITNDPPQEQLLEDMSKVVRSFNSETP